MKIENTSTPKRATGFILWFEDEHGEEYKVEKRNDVFIPTEDFDFVKNVFEGNHQGSFDIRGNNYFNRAECELIVEAINRMKADDENQNKFLCGLSEWINGNLKFAETLVVYGNL